MPERCLPESLAGIYLDTKANGGKCPKTDDMAFKFGPEAVRHSRFIQLGASYDEWNRVEAKGWMARAYLRMMERWQCEMVLDLDALNVKYGGGAVANVALRVIGGKGTRLSDYPKDADTSRPETWTLEAPLSGKEMPGVKIEIDPREVTKLQKREREAAKAFDEFYDKLIDTQGKLSDKVNGVREKAAERGNAYKEALSNGKLKKAKHEWRELMKVMREYTKVFTERARTYAKLPDELDRVIEIMGSERADLYDTKAAILLNLFDSDPSSYTTERGAKCAGYLMKVFDINPSIVHIKKMRDLMKYGCIREAAPLIKARLRLEPDNAEVRLLAAICDLRMCNFKEAREGMEKVLARQDEAEVKRLLPEINRHAGWITAADKLYKAEQKRLEEDAKADDLPRVELDTTKGKIVIELFEDDAPNTVKNFVSLAEKRFYNGIIFHRVEGWVVQTGDPEECGMGGPGYAIKSEPNDRKHWPGYVGMARSAPDSEGSQFYFMRYYTPHLDDARFTVFGRIVEGMDVLDKIERMDAIKTVKVVRKRETTKYEPVKNK